MPSSKKDASNRYIRSEEDTSKDNNGTNNVQVIVYAEDQAMYQFYQTSRHIILKKAWEIPSKFTKSDWSDSRQQRFTYSDKQSGFRHLVSRRPTILLQELQAIPHEERNVTRILFMDLDTIILQDPRPYFHGDYDFWGTDAQNDWSGPYNTGMLVLRPTPAMIRCIEGWRSYLEKQETPKANQKTFNNVVRAMKDQIRHHLLPPNQFPVGKVLLGRSAVGPHSLGNDVVVFHNNWCERGCSKPERARQLGLWNPLSRNDLLD